MRHGGEVRGTCLDGYRTGRKSERGATEQNDQAEGKLPKMTHVKTALL